MKSVFEERKTIILLLILFFLIGLALLYYGAEWLVKGSSALARSLGIRPIVIGLTVVAFGTSAPELVISLFSSLQDKSMIAVGNVIGSNICNIALVLGLAAVFNPLTCPRSVVQRDIMIMLGISLYLLVLLLDSRLGRIEGATLAGGIILYTYFNYWVSRREFGKESGPWVPESEDVDPQVLPPAGFRAGQLVLVMAGIAGVVIGAQVVVDSAVKIMTILGVSEKFIGLTMVAFGTSLPELATSVIAAVKKEMDISIGNLVGSNVFNIMCVLGVASLARPIPIPGGLVGSGLLVDYGVMMLTGILPWIMMRKTCILTRKDGLILLVCYGGYLLYLVMNQ
ncbi:MAG: calcium/sodium antiporter [Deltaproteobacteria bacterium]|nr:calcium/sodium antiporter [Deltaproteobacteria bacterium]